MPGASQPPAPTAEGIRIRSTTTLTGIAVLAATVAAGCTPASAPLPGVPHPSPSPPSPVQPGGDDPAPYPSEPFVAARSAREFGDTLGVNVRLTWIDTSYGEYDILQARLRELGARHVHDGLCPTCLYQVNMIKRLAADGIESELGVGDLRGGSTQMQAALASIKGPLRGAVDAVAAPNEPDLEPVSDWVTKTRAFEAELYSRVKSDPVLAPLGVVGPSLVRRESRAQLGNMSANLDYGNLHPYPGGSLPLANFDDERTIMSQVSGSKPLVITEVGYHADTNTDDPHRGVSESVNAAYSPRILLEAFRDGIKRTYFYQFADAFSDAQAASKHISNAENSFGLLRHDLTPRPSFIALRNLLRAVDGDSAPVASPGGLKVGVEGAPADMRQQLLRSADGTYSLVLWRQVSLWDRTNKRPLTAAPDRVDVVTGQPLSLAQRFDPVNSDTETGRWANPRRISVDLAGAPVVLRLTPAGVTASAAGPTAGASGVSASASGGVTHPGSTRSLRPASGKLVEHARKCVTRRKSSRSSGRARASAHRAGHRRGAGARRAQYRFKASGARACRRPSASCR